jgi:hypothetical protein
MNKEHGRPPATIPTANRSAFLSGFKSISLFDRMLVRIVKRPDSAFLPAVLTDTFLFSPVQDKDSNIPSTPPIPAA